jgi:hypothetical protein
MGTNLILVEERDRLAQQLQAADDLLHGERVPSDRPRAPHADAGERCVQISGHEPLFDLSGGFSCNFWKRLKAYFSWLKAYFTDTDQSYCNIISRDNAERRSFNLLWRNRFYGFIVSEAYQSIQRFP